MREAAELMAVNADAFIRQQRVKLASKGQLRVAISPETSQRQWYLDRGFHPCLAVDAAKASTFMQAIEAAGRKRREKALMQLDCVRRFNKLCEPIEPKMTAFLGSLRRDYPSLKISARSLFRWKAKISAGGFESLIDTRGGHQAPEASPEAWAAFEDLYLHQNQPAVRHCWKLVRTLAAENSWRWVSYSQCRRKLDGKISPEKQLFHREPERHRQQLAPFIPQDVESFEAGECFVLDHHQFNIVCRHRGSIVRPILTAAMCWRTRKIVGWFISEQPNSSTIMGVLKMAFEDENNLGLPKLVKIDNGRDFCARVFHGQTKRERQANLPTRVNEDVSRGILAMLGIDVSFADPFNPNGKARLERWFRNLESFYRGFDTYTGNSIDTKPERLSEILSNPGRIPDFSEVQARFADFVAGYNANADHSIDDLAEGGVRLSPADAYQRWHGTRRIVADPVALGLMMQMWHKPAPVTRRGISLCISGATLHYGQFEPLLSDFKAISKGNRPLLNCSYDPQHHESIRVYDSQFRFICTAKINQIGGQTGAISREHISTLMRDKSAYTRSLRHVAKHGLTQQLTTEERLAEVAARQREEDRAREEAPPAQPIRLVQTALDGQSKAVRNDQTRREFGPENATTAPANPFEVLLKNPALCAPRPKPKARAQSNPYDVLRRYA